MAGLHIFGPQLRKISITPGLIIYITGKGKLTEIFIIRHMAFQSDALKIRLICNSDTDNNADN